MACFWTPGPWEHYGSLVYANRPKDGGTICQVSEVRHSHIVEHKEPKLGSPDSEEIYANARLIAAAPELFTALKNLVEEIETDGGIDTSEWPLLEEGKAALARAEGQQP